MAKRLTQDIVDEMYDYYKRDESWYRCSRELKISPSTVRKYYIRFSLGKCVICGGWRLPGGGCEGWC